MLMTDAYAAYAYFNKIKDCTHVCCWAHARRIFYYAFKDYKDKFAKAFLDLIECLYKIEVEHIIFHRTEEEIVNIRNLEKLRRFQQRGWSLDGFEIPYFGRDLQADQESTAGNATQLLRHDCRRQEGL